MSNAPGHVELSIKFDNTEELFFSGEPVTGFVTSRVNQRLKVSVLKVVLLGEYQLFKNDGGRSVSKIVNNSATLTMDGKVSDIPAGTYDSPFEFMLGALFPSSVACLAGSVVYKVVARCGYKLTEKSDICTLEAVSFISVSRKLDLIECPYALVPTQARRRVAPGGFCSHLFFTCCGDELQATLEIPRRAYVCGERIVVSATIINQTSHVISQTKIEVLQILKSSFQKHKVSVVRTERGMVMKYSNRVWMNELLTVPALPPSSDDPVLQISYQIRISLTRDDGKHIKVPMPIIIGNVPLNVGIIESRGKELSFSLTGAGDLVFLPSYLVYRISDSATEAAVLAPEPYDPSVPEPRDEHSSDMHDIPLEPPLSAPCYESQI